MSTNHQQTVYIFSCTLILKTLKKTRKTVYIFSWTEDEEAEAHHAWKQKLPQLEQEKQQCHCSSVDIVVHCPCCSSVKHSVGAQLSAYEQHSGCGVKQVTQIAQISTPL